MRWMIFPLIIIDQSVQCTNSERSHQLSMYLPNKSSTFHGEPSSNMAYSARFQSNTSQSSYNRPVQFNPSEQLSSQRPSSPTCLVPSSFQNSTRTSIDFSSFKNTSIAANSTIVGTSSNTAYVTVNTSPAFSSNAIRNTYLPHQNVPDMIYSPLTKHFFWNTHFFHSQAKSTLENLYPNPPGNISEKKIYNSTFSTNSKITEMLSSNCSDINSDSDSLDVSDNGIDSSNVLSKKQGTDAISSNLEVKKRNPYSIEELLKKPEKRLQRIESLSQQTSIVVHEENFSPSAEASSGIEVQDHMQHKIEKGKSTRNNQITIEVCD